MDKKKILVGENDAKLVKMLTNWLQDTNNYDVITALTGQEVIYKVHQENPDLIIMNVSLPVVSGYQVCTQLKHEFQYKRVPIILLGDKNNWKDRSYANAVGVDDFLVKPLKHSEFLNHIQTCFARRPNQKLSVLQFGRKKVLIADHDKNLVQHLVSRLEAHSFVKPDKYVSLTAGNGSEALEITRRDKPDLVAIAGNLPGMDGYKFSRNIKSEPAISKIPVVILSNETEEETKEEVRLAQADGYLIKPIDLRLFIQKIKSVLWEQK